MNILARAIAFAAIALIAIPSFLLTDDYSSLDQFIEDARNEYHIPGVSVAIVKDDKIVFIKGYGVLEAGKGEYVNEHTLFQLASVSKTFTAAALGIQTDRKLLDWNDEIIKHLPAFALYDPYSTRYSTALDLLAHRTGLPAFAGDLLGQIGYNREEILFRARFIAPSVSFREKAQYSNMGFFVAGELLSKLAKAPFETVIKDLLLTPLKMSDSGFGELLDGNNVAASHAMLNGVVHIIAWDRSIPFAAAGGIVSSASDMTKWIRMLLNHGELDGVKILNKDTVDRLFQPSMVSEIGFSELPPISVETGFSYGLGWGVYHYKGNRIIEKGGGLDGMRSLVTLIPEKKIGIVILSNLNLTVYPELIRAKFLADLYGTDFNGMRKTYAEANKKMMQMLASPTLSGKSESSKRLASDYAGLYTSELYGDFMITEKADGTLSVAAGPGKWEGKLKHFSNDTFLLSWPLINYGIQEVTFTFGPDGKPVSFTTETLGMFTKKQTTEKSPK